MANHDPFHLDAGETAFFSRQLEAVKSRTYDTKFKTLKALDLLPISTDAPSGADTITYRRFTDAGLAKIIADYAHDFPRADVYGEEVTCKIYSIGTSYGYSIKEIRRAQMAGINLDQRRANAARRANDELVNKLALTGDAATGINGLLSYPGVTLATIPNGAGGSKAWNTKTPDEIVNDIQVMIDAVMVPTNSREVPDTLLLPIEQYNHIANTRMSGNDDNTILTFILKNNPYLKRIDWLAELATAGEGGTARAIVLTLDPEHVTLEIPQAFEQFAAQWKGMEAEIPCHSETAGIIVYYPLSVAYGDGI